MPRDIPVGNGNLLVNFDQDYNLKDIYYPHVGKSNHSNRCTSLTGVWVDGQLSWLSDPQWAKQLDYAPETLATEVTATNSELGLELAFQDLVDFHQDIFLRRVIVSNLVGRPRRVRLLFHYDLLFFGLGSGDAMSFARVIRPGVATVIDPP